MAEITINNWQKGMSLSAFSGDGAFAESANIDVFSKPGIAQISVKPTKISGSTVQFYPAKIVGDPNSNAIYISDLNNNVYEYDGSTFSEISDGTNEGGGIAVWNDYLITRDATKLNAYGPLSGSPSWTEISSGFNSSGNEDILVSQNTGYLYITNDSEIAILQEDTTFDPGDSGTYTLTTDAITLPGGYHAISVVEQKENILVASHYGDTRSTQYCILLWNNETNEFNYPVNVPHQIDSMFSIGNRVYISLSWGGIYLFSESGLKRIRDLPTNLGYEGVAVGNVGQQGFSFADNNLIMAVMSLPQGESVSIPVGLYFMNPQGRVCCQHTATVGSDGDTIIPSVIYRYDNNLYVGWVDTSGPSYGVDKISNATGASSIDRVTSYDAYITSLIYRIGTFERAGNVHRIEVYLAKPLTTDQGIKIQYRENTSDSWSTVDTITYSADGGYNFYTRTGPKNLKNIQLKISLTTGASSSTTPYLREVKIIYG